MTTILVALIGALGGAMTCLAPILLHRARQKWKERNRSDADQSLVRLKLIDVGESQRVDLQGRYDRERERADGWMGKYYESQMELAKVKEAASVNNLRIVDLDRRNDELERRITELEKERERCTCEERGE